MKKQWLVLFLVLSLGGMTVTVSADDTADATVKTDDVHLIENKLDDSELSKQATANTAKMLDEQQKLEILRKQAEEKLRLEQLRLAQERLADSKKAQAQVQAETNELAATISTKQAELDKQAQEIADLKQEITDRKANYADMLRATQSSTVADKLGSLIKTGSITEAVQEAGQIYMLNQALQERIKDVQAKEEELSALVENNQKAMADLQNDKSALDSKLQASQAKTAEMQALVDTYSVTPSADAGTFTQTTSEVNRVLLEAQQALAEKASGKVYGNGNPNTYASGQCTWGVAWAAAGAGVMVGNYWGDGGAWDDGALRAGATVTAIPEAGAFVSFPPGVMGSSSKYGHIAFVGEVDPEAKTATIWEMNVYGNYSQSVRTYHYGVGESYIIP